MTARRLRPINRLISCVRPPIRPFTDSRSERVLVARGSIAYSLVTQPSPLPLRQRGTPSVTLAATSTRVEPNSTRTDPSACSSQPLVKRTGRRSSGRLPSLHETMPAPLGAGSDRKAQSGGGEIDRAGEMRSGLGENELAIVPGRDVGEQEPAHAGGGGDPGRVAARE